MSSSDPAGTSPDATVPKVCTKCGAAKTSADFYRSRGRKDGLHDWCKPCVRATATARYRADPEGHRARQRALRHADPERFRAYTRKYRAANLERDRTRCRSRYRADPERFRVARRKHRFGLTREEFAARLAHQDGKCAICGRPDRGTDPRTGRRVRLAPDHDHACCPGDRSCGRCIRGLLCATCNVGLGMFRDNPEYLARAIDYLRRASA